MAVPPPSKRRKTSYSFSAKSKPRASTKPVEELSFDIAARQDYLSGFHKRKVQRTKRAQEENAKKEREEKVKERRQLREQRKQDLEAHVAEVNALVRMHNPDLADLETSPGGSDNDEEGEGWGGIQEPVQPDGIDEYVDEDKYTAVTIETMDDARAFVDGNKGSDDEADAAAPTPVPAKADEKEDETGDKKRKWTKERPKTDMGIKKKKKKFRYESKAERQQTRRKQKSKNSSAAKERKEK